MSLGVTVNIAGIWNGLGAVGMGWGSISKARLMTFATTEVFNKVLFVLVCYVAGDNLKVH